VLPYHLDREKIVGGLVITYGETYAWFKRKFGFDLAEDHTEDLTIVENAIDERGYSNKLEFIQRQSSRLVDLLLVTQAVRGPFPDAGWIGTQVFQEEWKELLKPGRGEEAASEILLREFGRWPHVCVSTINDSLFSGIVATEFKCTFR